MVLHDGMGLNWPGYYTTGLVDYYGRARRAMADNFSDTVKLSFSRSVYGKQILRSVLCKGQNLVHVLKASYDEAFKSVDILIMPTIPMKAMPIPENPTTGEYFTTALGMIHNTCPFDCTHHPP